MITSARNPKVTSAVQLKKRAYREREGRFLVEGAQAVGEALGSAGGLRTLFHTDRIHPLVARAGEDGVELVHVSQDLMSRLTDTVTPQGLVGVAPFIDVALDAVGSVAGCVALLHAVRDPGNAGTVVRSADASGADGVVFCGDSVDVYNPKTVRASAGSLFHLPIVREAETERAVAELRARGHTVLAMDARGQADLYELDLSGSVAFLFGNEAWGLPAEVVGLADRTVRVPISGRAESLNLAAAATVCLFEWARQRERGPGGSGGASSGRERASGRPPTDGGSGGASTDRLPTGSGASGALETLIAAAAHDIRSPLTAMKGFGYALSTRWTQMTEEQRALMLEGIVYDTDRMNTIVRQLVDAARIAGGSLELFPERVDVGELVGKVSASLARDPEHPGIEWEGGEVRAFVDPDRLRSVIEAFVEALVWWAFEGPVRVRGECRDGRLVLEAFRARTEITPEEAEGLFRPRRPGEGGGSKIGLFVSDGVARAQGGSISVEVRDGLRFRLDVPAPEAGDVPA